MNKPTELIYRRVRRSESNELVKLCEDNNRLSQYYSGHSEWLKRAIREISSNSRVVFGAFEHKPSGFRTKLSLTACIFLKYSVYQRSMELKNIILPQDDDVALQLIEKAVRFCEVRNVDRNVDKIEVEIPQDEHRMISLFLQKRFKIISTRQRFHSPTIFVCTLERSEGNTYLGDPFDILKVTQWLVRQYVHCEITKVDIAQPIATVKFTVKSSGGIPLTSDKSLTGVAWVFESISDFREIDLDTLKDERSPIKIAVTTFKASDRSRRLLRSKNVILFDKIDLLAVTGGSESSLNIPFARSKVGGFVTVLEFKEIQEYLVRGDSLTYFLFGVSGKVLFERSDSISSSPDGDSDFSLIVYCPDYKEGILGFYKFSKLRIARFDTFLKDYRKTKLPDDTALPFDDLEFYSTFSKEQVITEIQCENFFFFEEPLPINDDAWESNSDIGNYVYNNIASGNNSFYIDIDSCERLNKIQTTYRKSNMAESFDAILAALNAMSKAGAVTPSLRRDVDIAAQDILDAKEKGEDKYMEDKLDPTIQAIVRAYSKRLFDVALLMEKTLAHPGYDEATKDNFVRTLAEQGLKFLRIFEDMPQLFPRYDELFRFFKSIKDS